MKILYAIQGTGNGHLTRAMEIVPLLQKRGATDVLLSGTSSDIQLPFDINFKYKELSFVFGKGGGVDIWKTYLKLNSKRFLKEIKSLDVSKYDLIISDFEPISAWACQLAGVPCIGLSNQIATLHPKAPKPKHSDPLGKFVLQHYAPTTFNYGFHYKAIEHNIFTPLIRKEVREIKPTKRGHYTVYLPSYDEDKIIKRLSKFKGIHWEVFSKHSKKGHKDGKFTIFPLDHDRFIQSIASSEGVLCNAGFGTTSEALHLGKKLLVVPMKIQYEQHCNSAMLKSMGVTVAKNLKKKNYDKISDWLESSSTVKVNYPNNSQEIVDMVIERHAGVKKENTFEIKPYPLFQ